MNTETTWRPENVEANGEMIKSAHSAERQTESTDVEQAQQRVDKEEVEYGVHDKLLGNSKAQPPPPPVIAAISKKKQRQLGPAPIASFEDISDEMDASGPPSHMPGIQEQSEQQKNTASSAGAAKLASKQMTLNVSKSTPRIDISRASSSSQHEDSRDSSPENVFEQIGTGTLQENAIEFGFREEGALELRSSTEELYFMEPDQRQQQQFQQQQCRSPVTVRIEDQSMDQYQRKDSVSSEVAALLCISGRTSRISSVGSQGSAASRLSAISGLSRSPSPHKMILETSFCGPKPVDTLLDSALAAGTRPADALEQMLLARKHDPTQAVMAEGITIKSLTTDTEKEKKNGAAGKSSGASRRPRPAQQNQHSVITPEVKITRPQVIPKAAAMEHMKIVGKTDNGTEYIRIKLKPDHFYDDQGLAANEKVVEDIHADVAARKPASLNIQKAPKGDTRKPSASPKPSKHIFGSGSRSPSPATVVTTSRKNSFCSLFKSKEVTSTPDSPTAAQNRKKSSASARENDELNSHRSRSCGKIKDMGDRLSPSPTPSKQKSVLGLFKTKRSGSASKSKSSSPVDQEERRVAGSTSPIAPNYASKNAAAGASKPRMRYYDPDTDNSGIFIPLHTPPDEKEQKVEDEAVTRYNQMLDKQLHETELGRSILRSMNKPIKTPETSPKHAAKTPSQTEVQIQKQDEITAAPRVSPSPVRKTSDHQLQKVRKSSRIEYPDGSIRIPLRSPSDEDPPPLTQVYQVQVECVPPPVVETLKRQAPPEPAVVVVAKPQSPPNLPPLEVPVEPQVHCVVESHSKNSKVDMVPLPQEIPDQQIEELPQPPPPTPASVSSGNGCIQAPNREKKHILFTTKLGSGEEQLFQTQFSVSKTESLCSPTSDANNAQSDNASNLSEDKKDTIVAKEKVVPHQPSSEDKNAEDLPQDPNSGSSSVIVQLPQSAGTRRTSSQLKCAFSTDDDASIKEPSAVMIKKQSVEEVVPEVVVEKKQRSTEAMDYKLGPQRTSTTEENALVSSGSDRDSETCTDTTTRSVKHLPHNLAIDEHESTGLVSQISYEDELPYVPTTLPEERAVGVPIISVKERATMEVKTYPVERPRSTTPLNPSFMDDYCGAEVETPTSQKGEKLKISLPRKDSRDKIQKPKSPRRVSNSSGKSWFEYEARGEPTDQFEEPPPPPLPPRANAPSTATCSAAAAQGNPSQWINFENIPEKRKPPKRITTVPQKDPAVTSACTGDLTTTTTVYQFVKPDECQCECHEIERKVVGPETQSPATTSDTMADEAQPLLGSDSNGTGKSAGEGCNSMSDLSTDYSPEEEEEGHRHGNEPAGPKNTACKSSPSVSSSDELLLPTFQKTDSHQRPFEFDLSVSPGGIHRHEGDADEDNYSSP